MRQSQYRDRLRDELREHGLYNDRNERLIECAARCQWYLWRLESELSKSTLMLTTTGCNGQEKVIQHPHVESIRKWTAVLTRCLVALGLGNDHPEEERDNTLEDFMEMLK